MKSLGLRPAGIVIFDPVDVPDIVIVVFKILQGVDIGRSSSLQVAQPPTLGVPALATQHLQGRGASRRTLLAACSVCLLTK